MTIKFDFKDYIIELLWGEKIGKGLAEYERAKGVLPADLSTDEYQRAVKLAAAWCGV